MKRPISRREILTRTAGGFGALAAGHMLHGDRAFANGGEARTIYDQTSKQPHMPPKAKNVIFVYIAGGASTIDMFDPKPNLTKYDGSPAPFEIKGRAINGSQQVMASPWSFKQYGQSGRPVSELMPEFTKVVDDVAFIRSMTTDRIDHSTAQFTFVTGRGFTGFPAIGAWAAYGLGTENQNLPAYIALKAGSATIGSRAYSSAWLPPVYGGTLMETDPEAPMFDIRRPDDVSLNDQGRVLDAVAALNRAQMEQRDVRLDHEFEARIKNYELAARMQLEAMKVADISEETEATKSLYGMDDDGSRDFGNRCLLARRLVESGVRFVQIISGGWDTHNDIAGALPGLTHSIDKPLAGLITDLKQRGMLEDTLVVWSSEFGRLPTIQSLGKNPGRDHNPYGFNMWMAGGGVKPGVDYGMTDELGYAAMPEYAVTHSHVHATILNQ
ncbi:MAG: DUF1501 domain-containing protein, partial [Acidimicrobiia bacterium]|nr:DUF1501 domain-containing protein [Acidimicrobiia bacterium]